MQTQATPQDLQNQELCLLQISWVFFDTAAHPVVMFRVRAAWESLRPKQSGEIELLEMFVQGGRGRGRGRRAVSFEGRHPKSTSKSDAGCQKAAFRSTGRRKLICKVCNTCVGKSQTDVSCWLSFCWGKETPSNCLSAGHLCVFARLFV